MDPASLVLTIGGLLAAFEGAVDTILLIELCVDDEQSKCSDVAVDLHIPNTRLHLWGPQCKLDDRSGSILTTKPRYVQDTILKILNEMKSLHNKTQSLTDEDGFKLTDSPNPDRSLKSRVTIRKRTLGQPKAFAKPTRRIS
ncbi:hypothetical protein HG530_008506 [Fusarium avenaceum]|nr:hypothetical protein DER45DRAFT_580900 [Fusarium avenaceum]KAI6762526.1 hypothetical protein HG530_008506 [Fusarium avenaceum]